MGQLADTLEDLTERLADVAAAAQSLIATVTTFVCSVCDKALSSNYSSCAKHTSCSKYNRCRDQGATVDRLTNIVGRHDRNVGGRQAQAPELAHNSQADADRDMSDIDDGAASGVEAPESG
jgi:hypothetical protein